LKLYAELVFETIDNGHGPMYIFAIPPPKGVMARISLAEGGR